MKIKNKKPSVQPIFYPKTTTISHISSQEFKNSTQSQTKEGRKKETQKRRESRNIPIQNTWRRQRPQNQDKRERLEESEMKAKEKTATGLPSAHWVVRLWEHIGTDRALPLPPPFGDSRSSLRRSFQFPLQNTQKPRVRSAIQVFEFETSV